MKELTIHLNPSYPIYIGKYLFLSDLFVKVCQTLATRFVIITDSHLADLLGRPLEKIMRQQGLPVELLVMPAGEIYKTRETKQLIENTLLEKQYGRDVGLIALGGGVVSDLVGFVAATYCRGVPLIYIPTTLLAMVDASIGGKTGVNTSFGKNMIGCFYQPKAVFMDVMTLTTLPKNEWLNGVVEMIKHGIIADVDFFEQLIKSKIQFVDDSLIDLIFKSCAIKKNVIEQDEKDLGIRQLLNFGHTMGHAIESVENYQISHGEAVAIGMLVESYLSLQCGLLPILEFDKIESSLRLHQLPLKTKAFNDKTLFLKKLKLDKKNKSDKVHVVLINQIGKPYLNHGQFTTPIDLKLLEESVNWALTYL